MTFFFVCLCAFPNLFFFPCVCVRARVFLFSWKMTNGKCENGSLGTWRLPCSSHMCAEVFQRVCVFVHQHECTYACLQKCVCGCISVNRLRCSVGSGKVWCVRLIEHGRIMTAVYTRSPMSILAHLLALSALADRWKAFSFQCSGKSCTRHLPKPWPWRWTRPSLFEHYSTEIPS